MHDNRQRREVAERMALNAPIQGSAADIIKVAMLNVQRTIEKEGLKSRLLLQIHDELIFEAPSNEVDIAMPLIKKIMEECFSEIILNVSINAGSNWREIH
jgi:DNA polymerase-1